MGKTKIEGEQVWPLVKSGHWSQTTTTTTKDLMTWILKLWLSLLRHGCQGCPNEYLMLMGPGSVLLSHLNLCITLCFCTLITAYVSRPFQPHDSVLGPDIVCLCYCDVVHWLIGVPNFSFDCLTNLDLEMVKYYIKDNFKCK